MTRASSFIRIANRCRAFFAVAVLLLLLTGQSAMAQRRINPVNNKSTATQPINELENDTARINARMRATMAHYHDEDGNIVYVDTVTGKEWRDSTAMLAKKPMQYPLFESACIGVDIWNPVMRLFGQHYGLVDFMAQLSLHNRYKPTFETGLGYARNTPVENNYSYKSPLSVYFRAGLDYNFLFNSTTDYQFFAGVRFGFSPFAYSIDDITINSSYWDETARPVIPSQHATAEWWELVLGLRVKLAGPLSAGWSFRYHSILHESKSEYGLPWYIPGYGGRGTSISGSFTITYTLQLNKKGPKKVSNTEGEPVLYFPETPGQPTLEDINQGRDAQAPGL